MKEDFSELIEYLDGKFSKAEKERADIRNEVKDLRGAVDTYAKKADTYFQDPVKITS